MGDQYLANSKFSQEYNPYLYYFPFPSIVSLGAFAFYPNFFSNGTYGAGGVANYESISSIIGAQFNEDTGHFEYGKLSVPVPPATSLTNCSPGALARARLVPALNRVWGCSCACRDPAHLRTGELSDPPTCSRARC